MKEDEFEAVIIGAGAAGLTALAELDRAGLNVLCLEARDRIGGRVYTVHDPLSRIPVELGAEFIHGRPPETWDIIRRSGLLAYDVAESAARIKAGKIQHGTDGWARIDGVMEDMQKAAKTGKDQSFASFLEGSPHSEDAKQLAMSYVEGFNAARGERISIRSLAKDAEAADSINGDRSFRFAHGYDSLIEQMIAGLSDVAKLQLGRIVERIQWNGGRARVEFRDARNDFQHTVRARRVVVTVPLGALPAIQFDPTPSEALKAAASLEFGQVMRVVLRFREAFWENNEDLAEAGFLFSDERLFPTWWTPLPLRAPILTGWCAGRRTDALLGKPRQDIIGSALKDLCRITDTAEDRLNVLLEAAYFHDWGADPFAGGAYSYVPVGAMGAREVLARPVEDTLYFAGEATETNGHSATVHGAIASGKRVAMQIVQQG